MSTPSSDASEPTPPTNPVTTNPVPHNPVRTNDRSGLRIGHVPGVTLTKWRRIWGDRFREPLDVLAVSEREQKSIVDEGEVDLCFVRLPIGRDGLHLIPLYDEVAVIWLSKDHVLSVLDEITEADLEGERVIADAEPESVELATYSAAVLRVPMSIARSGSRKDLVHRPLVGAEPTTIGLAWRVDNENTLIDEFIGVVRGRKANSSRTEQERHAKGRAGSARAGSTKAGSGKAGSQKASNKGDARRGAKGASAQGRSNRPGGRRPKR